MSQPPSYDLPVERPASIDERGRRIAMHPAEVHGRYRTARTVVSGILLVIFLVLPWIRIAGQQAILLDIPRRRFAFFGLTFWAHDAPMLVFVLGAAAVTLLFVTAVFGRVWCGWACPQTVFIDMVYRRIERLVEGDARKRRKLQVAPWTASKIAKRTIKWALFAGVSLVIAHSFLAYFVGVDRLAQMVRASPVENPGAFGVMLFAAGLTLFDFGWFREQFCIIACPYGRLQSVLMDTRSLAPLYDANRGEPRKTRGLPPEKVGDCVNCYRCVQVCPTGVDIRRGLQMECIACTACIDACDEVMTRLGKQRGLIRYDSQLGMQGQRVRGISQRAWAYMGILAILLTGLVVTVQTRQPLSFSINRAPDAVFTQLPDGMLVNHVRFHAQNQTFDDLAVRLEFEPPLRGANIVAAKQPFVLKAGEATTTDLFLRFPSSVLHQGRRTVQIRMHLLDTKSDAPAVKPVTIDLLGPLTER